MCRVAIGLVAMLALAGGGAVAQEIPDRKPAVIPADSNAAGSFLQQPGAVGGTLETPQAVDKAGRVIEPDEEDGAASAGSKAPEEGATDALAGKDKNDTAGASQGINVLERMGADLPALPAEKPFEGRVDEAYGAYQRGFYLTAMELALPRAQLGDAAAQTLVAEIFDQGLGVKRNRRDAAFWYGQAAQNGDPAAMFKYALLLMEGSLVPRDRQRADELMKKAADLGNPSAQFNYAQVLVANSPGEKGLRDAMPYYEKSAEQGISDAQYALSQIYANLKDLPKAKRDRAREWLLRAARAGYDTAQLDLAIWLINGTGGKRSYEDGFGWMKRAAERGNVVAQNRLSHLYINAIGTRPDPVEAAKWFVLSRRAGLKDPALEDFYLGLTDEEQKAGISAANKFRSS
ncbi:tetratricopeptide repeat protein [Rhizobium alarense]|uniref:tetratricopeptide repeat protein n=1 Tax=Rhizobium alarense TaxID=2846851 RepID=UPI001F443A91|nr:tetratricopeptide repeat protein [Rhizobium alarense]